MRPIKISEFKVGDYVLEMFYDIYDTEWDSMIGQIISGYNSMNAQRIVVRRHISGAGYGSGEIFTVQSGFTYYLLTEEEVIEHVLLETI